MPSDGRTGGRLNVAVCPWRYISLFSGAGGLDLGVKLAVPYARTVCYVEREAFPVSLLVQRMQEGWLDDAPVWSDACTFDGTAWRGAVDCVVAGFPCPPVSVAGKRLGTKDPRWLWPQVARIIRETGCQWVFLENVRGLLSSGDGAAFGTVLGNLADLGFDAEWDVFSAQETGAPHRRERVFVLAKRQRRQRRRAKSADVACQSEEAEGEAHERQRGGNAADGAEPAMVHTTGERCEEHERTRSGGEKLAASELAGNYPPGPVDDDRWRAIIAEHPWLAPAIEPGVRVLVNGLAGVLGKPVGVRTYEQWLAFNRDMLAMLVSDNRESSLEQHEILFQALLQQRSSGDRPEDKGRLKEKGTTSNQGCFLPGLRGDASASSASSGPFQGSGCRGSVPEMSCGSGQEGRLQEEDTGSPLCDLRNAVLASEEPAKQALQESGVPEDVRSDGGHKTMDGTQQGEDMLCLQQDVCFSEKQETNLQPGVFSDFGRQEYIAIDESRVDQLRAIGNGVVPLSAALAFVTLARRLLT